MIGLLPRPDAVIAGWVHREVMTPVAERNAVSRNGDARTETAVVALDERNHIAFAVGTAQVNGTATVYIDRLRQQGFRVEVDGRNEKIGKKIREATLEKIPFMLVVGDRDMEAGTVSVRTRTGEDLGAMTLADFSAKLRQIVDTKAKQ